MDNIIEAINRRLPQAQYPQRMSFIEFAPWLALLSAGLGLLLGGRGIALLNLFPMLAQGNVVNPVLFFYLISPVLALVSFFGLRDRMRWGWWLFFISELIDLIFSIFRFDPFGILFGLVFSYLLLQTYFDFNSGGGGYRRR